MGGKFEKSDRQLVTSATERLKPKWHTYASERVCNLVQAQAVYLFGYFATGRPGGPGAIPNAGRFPPPPGAAFGEGNCYNHKFLVFVQQFPFACGPSKPATPLWVNLFVQFTVV